MLRIMAESDVAKNLSSVLTRIIQAHQNVTRDHAMPVPRLVAVTKTKPKNLIYEAYNAGQRHFGENYVAELEEKSNSLEMQAQCPEIRWHFIGHLQSNKVNKLVACPNLYMIETIDSIKLANMVNKGWVRVRQDALLNVMVQINTSNEESKHGCEPSNSLELVRHVIENCPYLRLAGIMTIGSFDHKLSDGPNPDFQSLKKCRTHISEALNLPPHQLGLSMGMSHDFEHAIEVGSTSVRVGSSIFGARTSKTKDSDSTGASSADKTTSVDVT